MVKVSYTGIHGGRSSSRFLASKNQFLASLGVDPDLSLGTDYHASGVAVPSRYGKFTSTNMNADVLAWITCPKVDKVFAALTNGRLLSYSSSLTEEALVATCAGGPIGGACYYKNYIYFFGTGNRLNYSSQTANFTVGATLTGTDSGATAKIMADSDAGTSGFLTLGNITGTFTKGETITDGSGGSATSSSVVIGTGDVSRYGPLSEFGNAACVLTGAWWGGMGKTALTDTSYPGIQNMELPNHWGFVHSDDSLYFVDFKDGYGMVHRIHTKKTTYEGDTDDTAVPSLYNALDLPDDFYPTCIGPYGNSVAILGIRSAATGLNQGSSSLILWNPTDTETFDQIVDIPDPVATAMVSKEGFLHVFSGPFSGGCRVSVYSGGDTMTEIEYIDDAIVPFPGAVEVRGERLLFGSRCYRPKETACVFSLKSRVSGTRDVQNIATVGSQSSAKSAKCTAIRIVSQTSTLVNLQMAIASSDTTSGYAGYKYGTGTLQSEIEFPPVTVASSFRINRVRIPLATAVAANTAIVPTLWFDDITSKALPTINFANYPNKKAVNYKSQQVGTETEGTNTFRLSLAWTGTEQTPVMFPIDFWLDVDDDEKN